MCNIYSILNMYDIAVPYVVKKYLQAIYRMCSINRLYIIKQHVCIEGFDLLL